MPLLILTAIVQIALIVHVMRTGRATYWIFVLLFMPGIGAAAYFIVELLPELSNSFAARRAMRGVRKTLNPGGDLRRRELEHRLSGSVDATRHLADELIEQGRFAEAVDHYRAALTGLYEHDPDLMLGLAQAEFFDSNEYTDILSAAELAPRHFKKAQKAWLGEARSSLARLS